jgi:transposase-like protein
LSRSSSVRERAAQFVASGRITNIEIAKRCGISQRALYKWLKNERFVARVAEILQEYKTRATKRGLALRALRIAELSKMYEDLDALVDARKADTRFTWIPGFSSGLVQVTSLTRLPGPASIPVPVQAAPAEQLPQLDSQSQISFLNLSGTRVAVRFAIDLAMVAQKCAILDQIASESGDRVMKVETRRISSIADLTDQELVAIARERGIEVPPELATTLIQ